MLAKKRRLKLTKKGEIFKKGKRVGTPLLFLFFKKGEDRKKTKAALVVGKKIDKRAAVRNKIKRMMAGGVKACFKRMRKGQEIVILARKGILGKSDKEIEKEVKKGLEKAGLLEEKEETG